MRSIPLLFVLLLFACQDPAPPKIDGALTGPQRAMAEECDSILISMVGDAFGASVLIAVNDTVILNKGYGRIDSAHAVRPTDTTLFNLASISKSFTALCVAQLETAGKLRRSDSLEHFFHELPLDKRAITIEQCLTHSTGLGQRYAADGTRTLADAITAIGRDTLDTIPGARFGYSNENYELLAAVVERVSGKPYETYLRKHVLDPAGLTHTKTWSEMPEPAPPLVAAFTRTIGPEVFGTNWGYIGSGGLYSCTSDLFAWCKALRSGKIISLAQLDTLWTPRIPLSAGHMARGWFISATNDTREIWTRGTEDWGHNGVVRWFPDRGMLIIVLTNSGELGDKNITGNRLLGDAVVNLLIPANAQSER